jgi:hypothetical protein
MIKNGQLVCHSKAIYGGDKSTTTLSQTGEKWETITGYEECPSSIPVKSGDEIVVEAVYDTTAHRL